MVTVVDASGRIDDDRIVVIAVAIAFEDRIISRGAKAPSNHGSLLVLKNPVFPALDENSDEPRVSWDYRDEKLSHVGVSFTSLLAAGRKKESCLTVSKRSELNNVLRIDAQSFFGGDDRHISPLAGARPVGSG